MKHLKKYFNQKKGYSLKEFFNMVMTVMTCFFTKIINEKLSGMMQQLSVSMGWGPDTDKIADGQAVVEQIGMRGRKGNRIRDVSYEKGLPCTEIRECRGSP